MFAGYYHLDHLTAFVDHNGLQIDGPVTEVMSPLPIGEKFAAFGWHVIETDGHRVEALHESIEEARSVQGKPTVIVMKTIKAGVFPKWKIRWTGTAKHRQKKNANIFSVKWRCCSNG